MTTLFTMLANVNDFASPNLVGAQGTLIHFDLNIRRGDLVRVTGESPMLIAFQRVTGYIRSDGQMYDSAGVSAAPFDLDDPGNLGVRLLANDPDFNLDPGISYRVSFDHIWEGRNELARAFNTPVAPSVDTTIDLASFSPGPGLDVTGIPALGVIDDLADATAVGKALMRTTSTIDPAYLPTYSAQTRVFDARDWGVVADGEPHNNAANLMDCVAAAAAAGGGEVLLPAGVIDFSDAVLGTVTADSGNTYTNNGGIALPKDTPMTFTGHGVGMTVLKLSSGFTRGFDFYYGYSAGDQIWRDITVRGITFDRNNMAWTAPPTTIGSTVNLAAGTWTTIPGLNAADWQNAPIAFAPNSNTGTLKNTTVSARVSGSNVQFKSQSAKTLLSGDVVQGCLCDHVIIGNNYSYGGWGNGTNANISNIHVHDCESVNVVTSPVNGFGVIQPTFGGSVDIWVANDGASSTPFVKNVLVERVRMNGGPFGAQVNGGAGTFIDEVWMVDCFHDTGVDSTYNYYSDNFMVGNRAWVGRAGLIRCHGRRSGDVAYEVDQPWEFHEIDCTWEDANSSACYRQTFVPPARTAAGPPTATLNGGITNSATSATINALPAGADRSGVALLGDELVWYKVNNTDGTGLTLWRAINGSTAAAHSNAAVVTFVETFKTRVHSVRSTITSTSSSGPGCVYLGWGAKLPLPPLTIRDTTANIIGGSGSWGRFIAGSGWMPDIDVQGVQYRHVGFTNPPGSPEIAMNIGGWPNGYTMYNNRIPFPAPRFYGRNNRFYLNGKRVSGGYGAVVLHATNSGYVHVDFDLDAEVTLAGDDGGRTNLVYFTGGTTGFTLASGSRLGIKGRSPGGLAATPDPACLMLDSSASIESTLAVDIDATNLEFTASSGDTNYRPWDIPSNLIGKIRFGKVTHSKSVTGNYPQLKRNTTKVTGTTYAVKPTDDILLVDTSSHAVTITMMVTSAGAPTGEPIARGAQLTIIDAARNAGTNNITVTPASGEKLDGSTASQVINSSGASRIYVAHSDMPGWLSDSNCAEGAVAIGTVSSSCTLDLANGAVQTATLTASTACTFTMPTAVASKSFVLLLKQAASTGNGTATFTSVKWNGGGAPTITATAGKMDILTFISDGVNWYGSYVQGYTP